MDVKSVVHNPSTKALNPSREMVFAGERYYNIYRIALTIIGLWPYEETNALHRIQVVFYIAMYIFFIFFQVFHALIYLSRALRLYRSP